MHRDSEESAPAEYPPEQPEVDAAEDDEATYGVEDDFEAPAEEAAKVENEDAAMNDVDESATAKVPEEKADDASDAGSEDLEAESSGSEDEEDEEGDGEGEGEGEDEMDTTEDGGNKPEASQPGHSMEQHQQQQDVMVH